MGYRISQENEQKANAIFSQYGNSYLKEKLKLVLLSVNRTVHPLDIPKIIDFILANELSCDPISEADISSLLALYGVSEEGKRQIRKLYSACL